MSLKRSLSFAKNATNVLTNIIQYRDFDLEDEKRQEEKLTTLKKQLKIFRILLRLLMQICFLLRKFRQGSPLGIFLSRIFKIRLLRLRRSLRRRLQQKQQQRGQRQRTINSNKCKPMRSRRRLTKRD